MVTLAFERGPIWLRQDGSDFMFFQVTEFRLWGTFYRDAEDFCTLTCSQRFPIKQECEEAPNSCKSTVASSDGDFALLLAVSQKCQQIRRRKIRHLEFGDWPVLAGGYVTKERTPSVAV
jgi:hypothetical protein